MGPHAKANVLIMRGVFASYNIPLWYGYDTKMNAETLNDIIVKVQNLGYHVIGITADSAPDNRNLANQLGVTDDSPYFPNPSPQHKGEVIYFLFDAVHLLKLMRNHLIDQGKLGIFS